MFNKLFGQKDAKPVVEKKDPQETIDKLNTQCESIKKRINVLENRTKDLKQEALAKRKAKDERGALMALKKMKMFEKELQKLDGQSIMLEQQKMMIESTNFDVGVISGMKEGATAMEQMNKQMNVDDIADLKEELEDQMAEIQERQEFFANAAEEDKEDLMGELDELEALAMGEEMEQVEISNAPIAGAQPSQAKPVANVANEEQAELDALEAMMQPS